MKYIILHYIGWILFVMGLLICIALIGIPCILLGKGLTNYNKRMV